MVDIQSLSSFNKKTAIIPFVLCVLLYLIDWLVIGFVGIPISSFKSFPNFLVISGRVIGVLIVAGLLVYALVNKNVNRKSVLIFSLTFGSFKSIFRGYRIANT